jgi:hypothetical protein
MFGDLGVNSRICILQDNVLHRFFQFALKALAEYPIRKRSTRTYSTGLDLKNLSLIFSASFHLPSLERPGEDCQLLRNGALISARGQRLTDYNKPTCLDLLAEAAEGLANPLHSRSIPDLVGILW